MMFDSHLSSSVDVAVFSLTDSALTRSVLGACDDVIKIVVDVMCACVCVCVERRGRFSQCWRWRGGEVGAKQRGQKNCACVHTSRRQATPTTRPDATSSGIDALRRPVTIKQCIVVGAVALKQFTAGGRGGPVALKLFRKWAEKK